MHDSDPPSEPPAHKGWHSRGYLPHFDSPDLIQAITFRLVDALPRHVVEALANDIEADADRRDRVEAFLNAGYGACYLADPRIGSLVEEAMLYWDMHRYRLLAWVVMPNHVHAVLETVEGHPLSEVLQAWKSYTAKAANRLLGRDGSFWHPDYFDRFIRDERHLARAVDYVHWNPVRAGLVDDPVGPIRAPGCHHVFPAVGRERGGNDRLYLDHVARKQRCLACYGSTRAAGTGA